jgi:dihydroflavonol-4-reductase
MTILITGATGFVGRNLLLAVLESKKYTTVYLPVRSRSKLEAQLKEDGFASLPPSIQIVESSAADWRLGEAASAEHVVHSAGVIFASTKQEYWDTNIEGTVRLLKALKAPKKIVVLSSLAAAGPSSVDNPRRENQTEAPVTWYGQSKLEMEKRLAKEFSQLPYICLRPPMIFGARDHATLPLFKMVRKPIHFKAGFNTKYYSVLSVEDLCSAILAALDKPFTGNRTYFVAHNTVITDRELLKNAAEVCGCPSRVLSVPQWALKLVSRLVDNIPTWRTTIPTLSVDRAKEIWPDRWVVSSESFESDFGWSARMPFLEALQRTRDWYIKSGQLKA